MFDYSKLKMQKGFLSLPEDDRNFLRDYKHHEEAIKMHIYRILDISTPLSHRFFDWVNKNAVNRDWYVKHINEIAIQEKGIELFGEFIGSQDQGNPKDNNLVWERNEVSSLPDWAMIVKKLPQKSRESFFLEVLEMSGKYLGSSSDTIATSKDTVVLQSVLYTRGKLRRK